jgi:ABC-type multidrug transport system ATPase subunit
MIRISGLAKRYGPVAAVRDLSLRVSPGEVYALLGPNGAGKTTALRCLAALLQPSAGSVEICEIDVVARPAEARSRLAYLSSSMGLYARLSGRELVAFFGQLHGLAGAVLEARVEAMVGLFGLGDFADRLCGKLSTGQRQRVSLARALVHDPPVLILDEPTLGLDVLSGQTIHEFIQRERGRGKAILLSTHQMEEVELLADRVGVLRRGELVAEGTPTDIVERTGAPNLARAFLTLVAAGAPTDPGDAPKR